MQTIDYDALREIYKSKGPIEYVHAFAEKYSPYFLARDIEDESPGYCVTSLRDTFIISQKKKDNWSRVIRNMVFQITERDSNAHIQDLEIIILAIQSGEDMKIKHA